jgi:hypothetical protein
VSFYILITEESILSNKVGEIQFYRLTDWNHSLHGSQNHTNFEAGFFLDKDGGLYLHGRVLDSNEKELFGSNGIRDLTSGVYQDWDPRNALSEFIEAIELQTIEVEATYFQTPFLEMTLEVKGPVANPKVFATTISMSLKFSILGQYKWQDSGHISIGMLCHKDHLLSFAKGLQSDLLALSCMRESS